MIVAICRTQRYLDKNTSIHFFVNRHSVQRMLSFIVTMKEHENFFIFKLTNNNITSMDISHSSESLTEISTGRFLSLNGEKQLLAFGFKLASQMITYQVSDVDALTIRTYSDGHVISNINDYMKPQLPKESYFTGNLQVRYPSVACACGRFP